MSTPRSRQRVRSVLAALSACGLAALAWASLVQPDARVIYNASDSVPVGWYRIDPLGRQADLPAVGSIVLIRLPDTVAALAAQRGYLPIGIPLLKRVGAVAPQKVCVTDSIVRIDGVPVAAALTTDRQGRLLQAWPGCRRLRHGELFLLSTTNPASFDSRYFGPISTSVVLGVAHPLWLERSQ
ncbi:S26 family signal peptidase [Pseudomonas sp. SST3]|jgi:conjugative transfer signal peptidase TraF|uniref:S26 family signal peptidase n=1 Tax=Pseudomonas sp. SST3 TaxID=2267882 RepID=UPI000DFD2343|nr:S26 family signal peptidase [Pseudomonas sp. SST3]NKQ12654.1 S26 family signal peptidase [Pseudomonas sp. SST3]